MAVLKIRTWPDPILKQKGALVDRFDEDLRRILEDMAETMYAYKGIGLAAQQVGLALRLLVCDVPPMDEKDKPLGLLYIVNPVIVRREGEITWNEGCLSFPGLEIDVRRSEMVHVAYQNERGEKKDLIARGLLAVCLQHEIDHVDGIVFTDRLPPLARKMALRNYERLRREAQGREVSQKDLSS